MEYEAYKVRGYGFGLKKEITGVLGRYPTQEEAQKVADDYTQACLPDNLPDSYDMGMVRPVAAGEPAALDTDVFAVGRAVHDGCRPAKHRSNRMPGQSGGWKTVLCRRGAFRWPVNNV